MSRFIDTVNSDGLYLLNLNQTDNRIRIIASFLNQYDPSQIMVVSARQYGQRPARMFAEAIGANSAVGRFIPGSLTNPASVPTRNLTSFSSPTQHRTNNLYEKLSTLVFQSLDLLMQTTSCETSMLLSCKQQEPTLARSCLLAPFPRSPQVAWANHRRGMG